MVAEHLHLVDRLRRSTVDQLERPVGGQYQQRNTNMGRFDDRRVVVSRRRSRRADEEGGLARGPADPQSEKASHPLVDGVVALELRMALRSQDERGAPRAR